MSDRGNTILRFADRYIGISLVSILGLLKKRSSRPDNFKNVGFLATAAIGDTLLISPVIKDFMVKFNSTNITIFCGKTNAGTFKMTMPNAKLVVIPVSNPIKAIRVIRKENFDLFFDFGPWPRVNSILTHFSKSRYKIGFKSINQYRHYVYNMVIPHLDSCHEIDNLRRLISGFGVESKSIPFLGEHTPNLDKNNIVVHMFPSGYKAHYKEWSDSRWVALINGLTGQGFNVSLTGAPKDSDACNRIYDLCKDREKIEKLAGKTNLVEVGVILKEAILTISVNTGIMHMAAAYNMPVIALNGPTSPLRWGPLCDKAVNLNGTTKGSGTLHLGFEYVKGDDKSLDSIDPNKVLEKVIEICGGIK